MILSGFHGKWVLCAVHTLGMGPGRCTSQRTGSWTLPLSEASFRAGWIKMGAEGNTEAPEPVGSQHREVPLDAKSGPR